MASAAPVTPELIESHGLTPEENREQNEQGVEDEPGDERRCPQLRRGEQRGKDAHPCRTLQHMHHQAPHARKPTIC